LDAEDEVMLDMRDWHCKCKQVEVIHVYETIDLPRLLDQDPDMCIPSGDHRVRRNLDAPRKSYIGIITAYMRTGS